MDRHASPGYARRLAVTVGVALATALIAVIKLHQNDGHSTDFGYYWYAARVLWQGGDPYQAIKAGVWYFDNGFMYPLSAALLVTPLAAIPAPAAGVIFSALTMAALAWAFTKHDWSRWPLLASFPCLLAFSVGQWAPLVTASALLPAFGFAAACKPTLGLACFAYRPTWRFVFTGLAITALAFVVMPDWPWRWIDATRHAAESNYHIPLLQPFGFLLPLALLRWRRPEARLLAVMSCIPQTMLMYDQVPLLLVARGRIQAYLFAILSYLIPFAAAVMPFAPKDAVKGPTFHYLAHVLTLFYYLPCLVLVLRRSNVDET